ncbi:hypothetical protein [Ammoniphilus resinae]|nr:hypothetical protein [Ammoniphilus resinae]
MSRNTRDSSKAASHQPAPHGNQANQYFGNHQAQQLEREQMLTRLQAQKDAPPEKAGAASNNAGVERPLRSYENYSKILDWLEAKAEKQEKKNLLQYFYRLSVKQQKAAIIKMAGSNKPSVDQFSGKMSTRNMSDLFKKTVDWEKFSAVCREVQQLKIDDDSGDGAQDYARYGIAGGSVGLGSARGAANIADLAGDSGGAVAATRMAPFGAALGALGSGMQIYEAYEKQSSSLSTYDSMQNIGTGALGGLADMTRSSAQTAETARTMAGAVANSAATTVAGAAAVVGGAAYLAGGLYGVKKHHERTKNLRNLENQADLKDDPTLSQAASLGKKTQAFNRTTSGATAAKGAAMIVGGALILAGVGPAGWILLGAAGLIVGAAAIYKFFKKRARKEEVVDRYLNLDDHMEMQGLEPEDTNARNQTRNDLLQLKGFNSVAQCYKHIIKELSHAIYEKGVKGDDPDYRTLLENIGLVVDEKKKEPNPELIEKKLQI